MALDTSLPISNKGANGSPITDSNGNPVQGVEVSLWRRVLNDTNSDGEGDEITDTRLLARTQTDSNGEYDFTSDDVPSTYPKGGTEAVYYCTVHAIHVASGSGDPLDNGRIKAYNATNEPNASDYMAAYSLPVSVPTDGLFFHASPYQDTYSNGDAINDIADQTGNARNLVQTTTSAQPEYRVDSLAGRDAGWTDGTDDSMEANSPASDWTFLNDDATHTIAVVFEFHGGNEEFCTILATGIQSSSETGISIARDDRSDRSRSRSLNYGIADGDGDSVALTTNDGVIAKDTPYILTVTERSDGTTVGRVNQTEIFSYVPGQKSSLTPDGSLHIANDADSQSLPAPIYFGDILVYNVAKTDSELAEIETELDNIYNNNIL